MPEEERSGFDRNVGAIDYDVLDRIGHQFARSPRFDHVVYRPEYAPNSVVAEFDCGYYPAAVERASLRIRWFENETFNVHYSEQYDEKQNWECRWDRHPNDHNTICHFHPPPDAATPGEDEEYPEDWRDVLTLVLDELDERIQSFWA